jgi:hypothetical protein
MAQHDWLTRIASQRTSRRAAGMFGVSLLAALPFVDAAQARRKVKKRRSKRARQEVSRCADGTVPCALCGGVCLPPDVPCDAALCVKKPARCGSAICGAGEYCCNESCSRCAPLGHACTTEQCPAPEPEPTRCGNVTCAVGEYCCNPSCSICAPLGGACVALSCDPPPVDGEICGKVVCPTGTYCCNASCGICGPPGSACIMIACVDEGSA